jgi:hypothetical protein
MQGIRIESVVKGEKRVEMALGFGQRMEEAAAVGPVIDWKATVEMP